MNMIDCRSESNVSTAIDTVLLKVVSRCNLDCKYCYVYHLGDDGWRYQPKRMSDAVQNAVVQQLSELYSHQKRPFSVVLHGGEPLLLGHRNLRKLCHRLRTALPKPCGIHIQTNGVLLTDRVIDIFVQYDVGVSVSLDGSAEVNDKFRVDHRGNGSHSLVIEGIDRLIAREDARPLFAGILSVIDPSSNPSCTYFSLKATGTPSMDFLVRDGNHDRLPYLKSDIDSIEYGVWMAGLLDVYLSDPDPPRIRIFDDMLRLILGGNSTKEGIGNNDYGILVIESDGSVNKNDTLKVAFNRADCFKMHSWSVLSDNIVEIVHSPAFAEYYRQSRPTATTCHKCPEYNICGGGMVAHRWSSERGFDNPTIFCADQKYLIGHMREWIKRSAIAQSSKGVINGRLD